MNTNTKLYGAGRSRYRLAAALLGALWALTPALAAAEQLPVYKLAEVRADPAQASALLGRMEGTRAQIKSEENKSAYISRSGNVEAEVYKASGGLFLRDVKQLWNADAKPKLPERDKARALADEFLKANKLAPADSEYIRFSFADFSETGIATDTPGRIDKRLLDVQVNYKVEVIAEVGGQKQILPVVGGGGDFKVALGNQGAVIGYQGVWRPIAERAGMETILSRAEAEAKFKSASKEMKITKLESSLAYYAAPAFREQSVLAPVWVVRGEAMVGGQRVFLRNAIIAATKYGPVWPEIKAKERAKTDKPPAPTQDPDEPQRSLLDFFISPAYANGFEAGTSWIGPSQGLGGSPANATGFVNELAGAGWSVNFNWGEANAWESDWNASDDSWVDAADFVFYTGHANSDGWVLNTPNDTFLHFNEVGASPGSPNDRYGQNDLEWVIIAACGPHQSSHFVGSVGNAFDRWRGIFDGLHVFLGYGAVTFDNTDEGERVAELALSGWTVIDAWFRAAWEIQPASNSEGAPNGPTIWVTAMYAHKGSHNTRNDRIWGAGTTVSDPRNPGQQRYLMWSGT